MIRRCTLTSLVAIAPVALPSAAHAEPYGPTGTALDPAISPVPTAGDPGDPIDINFRVQYDFESRHASIEREAVGLAGQDPNAAIPLLRDLVSDESKHTITPRMEVGIWHDVWVSAALPIVLSDRHTLSYDQGNTPCTFTGGVAATCVNATNSSTIHDGILPAAGFDSDNPTAGVTSGGATIFRGVNRSGLDQLQLGIGWAPMNQRRDDTKPTWKIGGEVRIAVGQAAHFDRQDPGSQAGVGSGTHELRLWTSVSKHFGPVTPFTEVWWQAPIGTTSDSAFADPGFGAQHVAKQQQAGTRVGFDATLVNKPSDDGGPGTRVSLSGSARMEMFFEGRNYSEIWEMLAYAGDTHANGPLVLDASPTTVGLQAANYPGVSNIENYLELGGDIGLHITSGRFQIGSTFGFLGQTGHSITFAPAGIDLPTCKTGQSSGCESTNNNVVTPGTAEVNPLHVDLIDLVGHRYHSEGGYAITVGIEAAILF